MYNNSLVSIVIPSYNSSKYIGYTIDSILKQTYNDWELVIVDDFSNDDTEKVVKRFKSDKIKYIKLSQNVGAAKARNIGIENSRGRYLTFIDADDVWKKERIEKQINFTMSNNYSFTFSSYEIMRENTNKVIHVPKSLNYSQFMKNTIIAMMTVMIDRNKITEFKFVDIRKDQDSMTWAKLLREGNIAYGLYESLAVYRKVEGSISNNKFKAAYNHWKNCRNIEKIPFFKCLYYFVFYSFNAFKKNFL